MQSPFCYFQARGLNNLSLLLLITTAADFSLTSRLLAQAGPAPRKLDVRKGSIEAPTQKLIANSTNTAITNPQVEPGKVRWHRDLAAARAAAAKSGKPVLLFQMMGKLDDLFC